MDHELPNSEMQYQALRAKGLAPYTTCLICNQAFTSANVKTMLGWRETQITGYCESCFDKIFEGFEDA